MKPLVLASKGKTLIIRLFGWILLLGREDKEKTRELEKLLTNTPRVEI